MRNLNIAAAVVAAALVASCMDQSSQVVETPDAAASRKSDFEIVEDGAGRLTVEVAGRRVVVAPPPDFCVDPTSVRDDGDAVFLLIGDCELSNDVGSVTVLSIGRGPLFGADRTAAFDDLEKLLVTEAGRKGVGMGGDAAAIRILDVRRTEDTLFALVEDNGERVADAFGARFWRAFTEINGRAAIAALGVDDGAPDAESEMLLQLSRMIATIREENGARSSGGSARTGGGPTG